MKKGWEIKKLGEVCDFFNDGNWIESKDQSENGFRLIQTGNVGIGEFRNKSGKERFVSEETFKRLKCTEIFEGDILISRLPDPVGRTCVIPSLNERMITAVDCTIVRLNKKLLLQDYFKFYSQSSLYFKNISEKITGTTRDRISRSNLGAIPIPIPSILEQENIVSILNETFAAIDQAKVNTEKNLNNAKELFQSELNNIFKTKGNGWVEKKLSEVALQFGRGKSKHRPRNAEKLFGGKYPFIQTGDVRNSNKFITEYSQTYNDVGLAQSKLWNKGTICITIAANIAETGILTFDSCFPDSMIGLVVDPKKAERDFAYYALQFLKAELQLLGKGSAQDNINMGTFENQTFPFPSLKEQQKIVLQLNTFSNETKKLESNYQRKLDELEVLKKSILQKAFSGELKTAVVSA
jgi:type I restriction enzyme S subunit